MKREYRDKLMSFKKKVSELYNNDECIIGNIKNNDYIQLIPEVNLLHKKINGEICSTHINHSSDMRKFKFCPKCKEELIIK